VNSPAALVVLNMSYAVASADSRFVASLRANGHDTSYFEERVASVIPRINALARSVRDENGVVVWVRPEWHTDTAADWPFATREGLVECGFDTPSHEGLANFSLLVGFENEPDDHYLTSFSPSAFWGSPLLATLRNLQVTDVLITGCCTESAVVINALDSTNTGFLTTVVEDACAGISEERHDESLTLHSRLFQVATTSDVITKLAKE
jgi:nicotinamidase-related amidase